MVLIDRSYRGKEFLNENGFTLHAILTISDILEILEEEKLITKDQLNAVSRFLLYDVSGKRLNFEQRLKGCKNPATRKLYERMKEKQSNLILSLDVDTEKEFFTILEQVSTHIIMVKTHIDILKDFTPDFITKLLRIAADYNILIFEDRKFADIGSTVRKQFQGGIYKISNWADFITVHMVPGPGILNGLFDHTKTKTSAFLLAAMSAEGNLITENYSRRVIEIAKKYDKHISGFIGFGKTEHDLKKLKNKIPETMLLLTPGVNLEQTGDGMGQQYVGIEEAVRGGSDAIIVGRGIYAADNPASKAKEYKEKAWKAFVTYNL
jgi:orotidine 5'-phosphate decarboxylase subfamily 1